MYNKRRALRNKKGLNAKQELEDVEKELSSKYSKVMADKILKEVQGLEEADKPPTAMEDSEGKHLTNDQDLLEEAI